MSDTLIPLDPVDRDKLNDLNKFTLEVIPGWVYLPKHMPATLHWIRSMSPVRYEEGSILMRLIEENFPSDEYAIYLNCLFRLKENYECFDSRIPQTSQSYHQLMKIYMEFTHRERMQAFYNMKKNWVHLQ